MQTAYRRSPCNSTSAGPQGSSGYCEESSDSKRNRMSHLGTDQRRLGDNALKTNHLVQKRCVQVAGAHHVAAEGSRESNVKRSADCRLGKLGVLVTRVLRCQ